MQQMHRGGNVLDMLVDHVVESLRILAPLQRGPSAIAVTVDSQHVVGTGLGIDFVESMSLMLFYYRKIPTWRRHF